MSLALQPRSLREAVDMLAEHPGLLPVAGCTDLMVCEREDRAEMAAVIDLLRVEELRGVRGNEGYLEIGATTTFAEIRRSNRVREEFPALASAAEVVGGWQIQNRATLGGNMANASPAGDSLPVLLALDARVVLVSAVGEREIAYGDFHQGYRQTALAPGELIGWIRLPQPPPGCRQFFRKIGTREAQSISKVVIALVGRSEENRIRDYRLAAGSVAATPIRFPQVEEALMGRELDGDLAAEAGRLAALDGGLPPLRARTGGRADDDRPGLQLASQIRPSRPTAGPVRSDRRRRAPDRSA
jgi:CO/xanthine dehydrogenase FAD-binding subunit